MKQKSISTQAFRVRFLQRSRDLYRRFLENKPWIAQLYSEFLELRPGIRIVDVGCGTGDFTRHLASLCPRPFSAIGVDNRGQSLQAATKQTRKMKLHNSISYKLGDAQKIPVEDNYSDLTCCRTLLMHLPNPLSAITDMARITKPGGLVVAVEGGRMVSFLDPEDEEYTRLSYEAQDSLLKGIRKLEGKEFKIGERLPSLLHIAGLIEVQAEIHADAWLNCDPRRKLKDVRAQIQFELSIAQASRGMDRRYLLAGGFSQSKITKYNRMREQKARSLLDDDEKLRRDTTFYGASFILVKGRKRLRD